MEGTTLHNSPWSFTKDEGSRYHEIFDSAGFRVCSIVDPRPAEVNEANARLIAAAPELLALAEAVLGFEIVIPKDNATKRALAFSPLHRHIVQIQNLARTTIAKVTGDAA